MTNATELIKITTNENGVNCVSARELHDGLGVEKKFTDWIKNQLENVDALENTDFFPLKGKTSEIGGRPSIDYILTVDIAKEICMVVGVSPRTNLETKALSKKFRKYFIACEKKLQEMQQPKQMSDMEILSRAVLISQKQIKQLTAELKEKTEFIDDINDCFTFTQISQFNKQLLRDRKDIVLSTATLNKVAAELNIPINKIENPIVYSPYRRVNAYPRKVWEKAYPDIKFPNKECK